MPRHRNPHLPPAYCTATYTMWARFLADKSTENRLQQAEKAALAQDCPKKRDAIEAAIRNHNYHG